MTARDRLRQIEQDDFDSWGEQDKGPLVQPLATPEEVDAITELVLDRPWEDPERYPACMVDALKVVGEIAISETAAAQPATQLLRRMAHRATLAGDLRPDEHLSLPPVRAVSKVPYGEPREPDYLEHDVLDLDERSGR